MKKFILILSVLALTTTSFAQLGTTCATPHLETVNATCNYTAYVTAGAETWFSFVATSPDVSVTLIGDPFGIDIEHVHTLTMYGGTCASLQEIASDELVFVNGAKELVVDASQLVVGSTYYLKASRTGEIVCSSGSCTLPTNANFILCLEGINAVIPPNLIPAFEQPTIANAFYRNKGQIVDTDGNPRTDIKAYTVNASTQQYFFADKLSYVFASIDTIPATIDSLHRVDMQLMDELPAMTKVKRAGQVPGYLNYYLGHVPTGIRKIRGFNSLVYPDVYPNIDFVVSNNKMGMKYFFVVRPGGEADQIKMKFSGQDNLSIDGLGGLNITTPLGSVRFEVAHAYKVHPTNGNPSLLPQPDYVNNANGTVELDINGNIPPNFTLVIIMDEGHETAAAPAVDNLEWSTYYGGWLFDQFYDIDTDDDHNVYMTGITTSLLFPGATGGFQDTLAGGIDAVVVKLDSILVPQWATYHGGTGDEYAMGMDINSVEQVYITGQTASTDLPLASPLGTYRDSTNNLCLPCIEAFVAKYDTAGFLIWSTYYGFNNNFERGNDVAIDGLDNTYIIGTATDSTPTQPKAFAYNATKGTTMLLKFNAQDSLVWATLWGTPSVLVGDGQGSGIDVDQLGNVYITGSEIGQFMVTKNHDIAFPQTATFNGLFMDAYVAKFDASNAVVWSFYFGGNERDAGKGIEVDNNGNAYVTGWTRSDSLFPLKDASGFFEPNVNVLTDAFILKVTTSAGGDSARILWSTYYGAAEEDIGRDITIDNDGFIYVVGESNKDNSLLPFPTTPPANLFVQPTNKSDNLKPDAFLAAFSPTTELIWTSYIGGKSDEEAFAAHVHKNDKLYMTGWTSTKHAPALPSDTFPRVEFNTGIGSMDFYQPDLNANSQDGFACRFDLTALHLLLAVPEITEAGETLLIYPNPARNKAIALVHLEQPEAVSYVITNITGKMVSKEVIGKQEGNVQIPLNIAGLPAGVYLVQIQAGEQHYTGKFVTY